MKMCEWKNYDCIKNIETNPPNNIIVEVLCDDFMGEYTMRAKRLDFKPGNKGRRKWRWVSVNGIALGRKETPNKWRNISTA